MKIIVMAKAPVAGTVKTRLCPPLDHAQAAEVARAALADTLAAVASSAADRRYLALAGPPGDWLPEGFTVLAQQGRTFAERLANAWDAVGGPALQIGMDTPQVGSAHLDSGFGALERSDGAVLGPAVDGGWWALGLLRADRRVFHDIPLSTADTGRAQRERLAELGLGPQLLPTLLDVDQWPDALAVARQHPDGSFGQAVGRLAGAAGGARTRRRRANS